MSGAQTCQWFALCGNVATVLVSHPILGEVPTCERCVSKLDMSARVVAVLRDGQRRGCLDERRGGCSGSVELRESLSGTGTRIPRCAAHWSARLDEQQRINERYPSSAPADFDPLYAGERWDDDY